MNKKILFIIFLLLQLLTAQKLKGISPSDLELNRIEREISVNNLTAAFVTVLSGGILRPEINPTISKYHLIDLKKLKTKAEVIQLLGQPDHIERYFADMVEQWYEILRYKELKIVFSDNGTVHFSQMEKNVGFKIANYALGTSFKLKIGEVIDPILLDKFEYTYDPIYKSYVWWFFGGGNYLDAFLIVQVDKNNKIILIRQKAS